MTTIRISHSFADREVNVLNAMLEAAKTGVFVNPEDGPTFQHTARKVMRMGQKLKVKEPIKNKKR